MTTAVIVTIVSVLPVFLVGGMAVQLAHALRFSPAGLGVAVAVYFGVSALAAVPAGHAAQRYGSAVTGRAAIGLSATALLVIALLVRSYLELVAALALAAAANALGQLASNLLLADEAPDARLGLTFGMKQSAVPTATLLAGASVPAIALTLGWRWAFGAAALVALAALATVRSNGGRPVRRAARGAAPRQANASLVTSPGLVTVGFAAALAAGGANSLGTFVVDSSVHRGLSPGLAGLTLTFGSAVCVAARLVGGWLADRRSGGHLAVVAGLLGSGATGLALLAVTGPAPLVLGVLLGFGLGWSWPGVMNYAVVRLHPQAPATATSISQTGVYAGGALGPLGFGALAAHFGYPTAWLVAAVALLLAAALMLAGRRLLVPQRRAAVAAAAARTPASR